MLERVTLACHGGGKAGLDDFEAARTRCGSFPQALGVRRCLPRPRGSTDVLAGYRVVRRIGGGGTGSVYAARDEYGADVALKVVANDAAAYGREVRALQALQHRNIVQMVDTQGGQEGKGPYLIVMELAEWGSLAGVVLRSAEAAAYVAEVASALQFIHERGYAHGDVKPGNILRFADGTVKLCDFGCCERPEAAAETRGRPRGTPAFMPPEAFQGTGSGWTAAVDSWGLAATSFCLVRGRPPFSVAGRGLFDSILYGRANLTACQGERGNDADDEADLANFVAWGLTKAPRGRPSMEQVLQHPWLTKAAALQHSDCSLARGCSSPGRQEPEGGSSPASSSQTC
ncbi:kinase-like domain-containing protein [Tribonema minus]|uniref:Kinase-like domain-containing protein n=1 Tax=Tribonema minus TaxID=303371 RepID=A0A836CE44_9STRA|nr:kinase-like domain-containing protein [Tribonema minus]